MIPPLHDALGVTFVEVYWIFAGIFTGASLIAMSFAAWSYYFSGAEDGYRWRIFMALLTHIGIFFGSTSAYLAFVPLNAAFVERSLLFRVPLLLVVLVQFEVVHRERREARRERRERQIRGGGSE